MDVTVRIFSVKCRTVAVTWLKQNHTRKKETDPEPDHGRKRRASFEEDRNIKRHETGEVAIHGAGGCPRDPILISHAGTLTLCRKPYSSNLMNALQRRQLVSL